MPCAATIQATRSGFSDSPARAREVDWRIANNLRVLRYLSQLDLEPGRSLRLVDVAPFNGPVTLEVVRGANGSTQTVTQILGNELARLRTGTR